MNIRWRVNSNGLEWFSTDRKWVEVRGEQAAKDFLSLLHNVTKHYPEQKP